ncbi:GNAT family N-acetyltransferase [Aromatoleum aromaticum]|uniref:GNAT family N-acetyltransferase n=1 Tax=Aromatoleum aromaticum TaxID=551760 RepID=UPI002006E634|nr:GNAT family N-acetyltransferase [Aromatoleum aromaticum]
MSAAYEPISKLGAADAVESFDCGQPALNQFLHQYALVNQKANSAQTYLCRSAGEVVGFYSLAVGSVDPESAPARVMKGLARHPVPVMILARLAVDKNHQGKGLGQALLKDALQRTAQAADRGHSMLAGAREGQRGAAVVRVLGVRAEPDRLLSFILDAQGLEGFVNVKTPESGEIPQAARDYLPDAADGLHSGSRPAEP